MFRCGSPGSSRPWRGFPIRTPWDHSPVIDSPRLIADSYVLLRLLMPRHPPCALKNLTTKDQGVIFERTMKTTTTPPKGHSDRSRFIFLEIASYKRCSRPLCSSQTTTPYHTPHTPADPEGTATMHDRCSQETRNTSPTTRTTHPFHRRRNAAQTMVLLPQDPTVCQTLNRPLLSQTPFQDHHPKGRVSVLGAGEKPAAAIC